MSVDLKGSITALITPFRNGAVDEQGFRALIEWQIFHLHFPRPD